METRSIDRTTLINITLFVEAFLLLTATFWSQLAGIELAPSLSLHRRFVLAGVAAGVGIAAVSLILFWLGKYLKVLSGLRELIVKQIAPLFADINVLDALLVACVSGFCEEILFRGVIQQHFGLVAAAVIFGLFHCPGLRHLAYGLWAFAAGFFLGWLYAQTGSLWVPILAHTVSNAISLIILRYGVKGEPPEAQL